MLPDKKFHDGPIINVGSEDNFKYFEHSEKQNHTQFLRCRNYVRGSKLFLHVILSFDTSFGTIVRNPTLESHGQISPLRCNFYSGQ